MNKMSKMWQALGVLGLSAAVIFSTGASLQAGSSINRTCSAVGNYSLAPYDALSVSVDAGDVVSWSGDPTTVKVGSQPWTASSTTGSVTATTTTIILLSLSSGTSSTVTCTLAGSGTSKTDSETDSATDSKTDSATDSSSKAGEASAGAQNGATQGGTSAASGRIKGDGAAQTSRSAVSFVSQGFGTSGGGLQNPDWNAWVTADARSYSDGASGHSATLTAGIDTLLGQDALVGLVLSAENSQLTSSGTKTKSTSIGYGAYFATRVADEVYLDVFAITSKPRYDVSGTKFTSERLGYGLMVSGDLSAQKLLLGLSVAVQGYTEKKPSAGSLAADNITSLTSSIAVEGSPLAPLSNGMYPFASIALEHSSRNSTVNGKSSFTSPRLRVGFNQDVGLGGLQMSIDAGRASKDIIDVGLGATYNFSF